MCFTPLIGRTATPSHLQGLRRAIGAVVWVAVENGSYDIVAAGLSVLLGRAGVAKHRNDALGIIRSGGMAVTALLVDHCSHDRSVAWLSITLAVDERWRCTEIVLSL